jgi:putative transposase
MSSPLPLYPGQYYHIYNRGNNRENIFREECNYSYFLKLYTKYILPIADTFAYCLLKNHFHLLVRIKDLTGSNTDLTGSSANLSGPKIESGPKTEENASQAFSNFFNAYSKAFNKEYERAGALFQRPFGRKLVLKDEYFLVLIVYIHQRPQRHGLISDFREWKFSSYNSILSQGVTNLMRDEILEWFQGKAGFVRFHQTVIPEARVGQWVQDDID